MFFLIICYANFVENDKMVTDRIDHFVGLLYIGNIVRSRYRFLSERKIQHIHHYSTNTFSCFFKQFVCYMEQQLIQPVEKNRPNTFGCFLIGFWVVVLVCKIP